MKAREIITSIVRYAEGVGTVEFPEGDDRMEFCEQYFGTRPEQDIPSGLYLWAYEGTYLPEFYEKAAEDSKSIHLNVEGDCGIWLVPVE